MINIETGKKKNIGNVSGAIRMNGEIKMEVDDDMVCERSYFTGQADGLEKLIERQEELKQAFIRIFTRVLNEVFDESIKNMNDIRDGMLKRVIQNDKPH
jgi:hypothetical protein